MKTWRHRLFVRALGWFIGVFASVVSVLLLVLAAYLLFFDYSEQLRARLESELTRLSDSPATIRSVNLDLPGFAFELRGIEVRSPGAEPSSAPIVEVERVWGQLRLTEMLNLRLHWNELLIEGLSLHVVEQEGGIRLPRQVPSGSLAAAGLAFAADHVTLENAFVVLENERVPWALEADHLSLSLDRTLGTHYKGRLDYDRGRLRVRGREIDDAALGADFELEGRDLFVREARISTDQGELRGTGKLSFAGGVRGRFDLSAEADAGPLAAWAVAGPEVWDPPIEGQMAFRGVLSIEPEAKQLDGTLTLAEGTVKGIAVADWRGELFWDGSLLQVSYAEGRVASGRAKLQLHQPLPVAEHVAALDIEVSEASLARLIEGSRSLFCPLASLVSGRASLTFPASAPGQMDGTFEAFGARPPVVDGEREALTFSARGRLLRGDVELEQAEAASDTLTFVVSGLYPREGSSALAVDVDSSNLEATDRLQHALRRLVRADDEPPPELLGIRGRGRARGRLTARLPHLAYDGELTAEELIYQGVRLEEVRTRGTISRERLMFEDLVARSGSGAVAGRGGLALRGPLAERAFDLELSLSSWPAEDVARAVGMSLPIEGRLTGDFSMLRGPGGLEGGAAFELSAGALGDRPIGDAQVRASLSANRLNVDSLRISRGEALVSGALAVDIDGHGLEGSLSTRRLPLEGLFPGIDLEGQLEARVDVGGRLGAPRATVSGRGRGLRLSGVELGEAFLSGELSGGTLDLHASFEREVSELVVEATCRFEGDYPVSGTLVWRQFDARPWILGADGPTLRIVSDGEASFRAAARGGLLDSLDLDAALSEITVDSEGARFVSSAPTELTLSGGRLEVRSLELSEGASRLALSGGLDLRADAVDFQATGVVDLQLFEKLYEGLETTGTLDVSARVSGGWTRPSLTGYADFRGGSLLLEGFPQALGGLRGRLVFDNRTVRIPELRGVFGSGPVTISGSALLDGLEPGATDLRFRGSDLRLRYPEGLSATLDADLALVGDRDERVLSGSVTLTDAVWSREYDLVSGILSDRDATRLFEEFEGESLIEKVRFDVSIEAPNSLRLRNSLAEIDASAELELGGNVREPVLLGRAEARRGDVYFLGQRYDILSGKVDFVDPTKVEPFIDLVADTRVRSYRVELRLTGTPDRFYPELSSDPPLRTVDILRLLAGASERDIGLLGNEEEELAGVGVASLLTERLTQEVGRRAERLFGLDRFAIDPFLIGQFANPTARVSLGKQITRDLIINYSTNLNATTEAIILIEYTPEGPMSWILSRSEEGDVGIDVKFRKSF